MQKNIDNIDKEFYERNKLDMSDETYQIGENEDILIEGIEVLEMRKLSSQKNIDYVEKKSDKNNQIHILDYKEYDERDQILGRIYNELESEESKLMKEIRYNIHNHLKGLIANKTENVMILLILILRWRQIL